jgi:hypothetical protein
MSRLHNAAMTVKRPCHHLSGRWVEYGNGSGSSIYRTWRCAWCDTLRRRKEDRESSLAKANP